jgi:hypothetical protein
MCVDAHRNTLPFAQSKGVLCPDCGDLSAVSEENEVQFVLDALHQPIM